MLSADNDDEDDDDEVVALLSFSNARVSKSLRRLQLTDSLAKVKEWTVMHQMKKKSTLSCSNIS